MDAPDPERWSGPDEATKPGLSLSATEAALTPSMTSQDLRAAIERADLVCGVALDQPSHVESRSACFSSSMGIDFARHKPPDDANPASSIHHAMSELRHGFDRLRQAMILTAP